jgi:acetyl/propionyl-CoA carboxylase alpha subunit
VQTNIPFHMALLEHPDFVAGDVSTSWLESDFEMPAPPEDDPLERQAIVAAALAAQLLNAGGQGGGSAPANNWQRAARSSAVNYRVHNGGLRGWRRGIASS